MKLAEGTSANNALADMPQYDQGDNIFWRLLRARQRIGNIEKTATNQHLRAKYADHNEVTEAVHNALNEEGLWLVASMKQARRHDDFLVDVEVELTIYSVNDPAQSISGCFWGSGKAKDDKAVGIAQSYAVKIGMLKLMGLKTAEPDPDSDVWDRRRGDMGSQPQHTDYRVQQDGSWESQPSPPPQPSPSAGDAGPPYPIVCSVCGKHDTVPFKPRGGAVKCGDCFRASK